MNNFDKDEARVSEKIALRLITMAASKGIMLPKGDKEIQKRFNEYADLMPDTNKGECSKWVAAEVYAFIRGFQISGRYSEETLKLLLKEEIKTVRSLDNAAA